MATGIKINCVIGIDPGSNGGIAVFVPGRPVKTVHNPKDVRDIMDFLKYYNENYKPIVFLEKLNIRPDDVSVDENGQKNMGKVYRIEKLMANYEHLKALIEVAGVPYVMVHPMTWQTKLKLRVRGQQEDKPERKRRYASKAGELYPGIKVTLWNADALLIMHFGRYALVNETNWVRENLPSREQQKIF